MKEQLKQLQEQGYTVLKNVIPKEDIDAFAKLMLDRRESKEPDDGRLVYNGKTMFPLGINDEKFKPITKVFTYEGIVDFLKLATDDKLMYCSHFDIHVGQGSINWHDDCQALYSGRTYDHEHSSHKSKMCISKLNMFEEHEDDTYKVYRVGIYLQDHKEKGGLRVIEGTHTKHSKNESTHISVEKGDVVVFDVRMIHKGERYENDQDRMTLFMTFGKDNQFTHDHIKGAITRQERQANGKFLLPQHLKDILNQKGISYES